MRELFLDAADAVWWVLTAPLRRVIADAITTIPVHQTDTTAPILKWSDPDAVERPAPAPDRHWVHIGQRR